MRRNLWFWSRYTWEIIRAELVAVAFLIILSNMEYNHLSWTLLASLLPYYLAMVTVLMVLIVSTGFQTLYAPLLISVGETRWNIFLGFQYHRVLLIMVTAAVSAVIWTVLPGTVSAAGLQHLPIIITILVMSTSLGSLIGTIHIKLRWLGTVMIMLIFSSLGATVGVAVAKGVLTDIPDFMSILAHLPWQLIATAALLLLVDVVVQWLSLRWLTVKL